MTWFADALWKTVIRFSWPGRDGGVELERRNFTVVGSTATSRKAAPGDLGGGLEESEYDATQGSYLREI